MTIAVETCLTVKLHVSFFQIFLFEKLVVLDNAHTLIA